ncbi:MAG: phosphoribosyltransferase [Halobacteriales archaeon]
MFTDRRDAGDRLAEALVAESIEADIVLGVPRGGVPVASVVAERLDLPLDVVIARKIGAPDNPELALGAVAADGTGWLNDSLIDRLGVTDGYLEQARQAEANAAEDRAERYRAERPPPDLMGARVLVVDDGVATGATLKACLRSVRSQGAAAVIVAIPVGPPETIDAIRREADRVVCLEEPTSFGAVSAHYRSFEQVSDAAVLALLGDEESAEE